MSALCQCDVGLVDTGYGRPGESGEDMTGRPRHTDKELEKVLASAERQGWTIKKRPNGYFKLYCPCDDKHMKTVHCTPSTPNYRRNLLGELRRKTCWKEEQ